MNFEELDGRAPLGGKASGSVGGALLTLSDTISPSDASFQKTNVLQAAASLTLPDSLVTALIRSAIIRIVSESLALVDFIFHTQIKTLDVALSVPAGVLQLFKKLVKTVSESVDVNDFRSATQLKLLAENLVLLDTAIKSISSGAIVRLVSENLTLADLLFKTQIKTVDEALSVPAGIQQVFRFFVKTLNETVSVIDFRSTTQIKKLGENLVLLESAIKSLGAHGIITKVLTENITVQIVATYKKIWMVLATKELTIYDQDRLFSYNIRCNEAFDVFTSFIKTINAKPPPIRIVVMEDDIKMFNSFLSKTYSRLVIDELISTADDFPYWVMRFANLIDNIALTDEIIFAKLSAIKKIVMSESLALDATFILRKLKILTENLVVADSGTQKTNIVTTTASLTLFEQFIKNVLSGGKIYASVIGEDLSLSDGTLQWAYRHKEFIENIGVTDSVNKGRILMQLISEVTALTDAVVKAFGPSLFIKIQSEGISVVDSTYAVKYAYRRLDEPLAVVDSSSKVVWSVRVPSETISVVDSTGQARIVSRVQAEALALTDEKIAYTLRQKVMLETLALVDMATRYEIQARIVAEGLTITDEQLHQSLRYQVASEALVLSDSQIKALSKLRTLSESVTVQDGFISVKISKRVLMELLDITDEALLTVGAYVTLIVRNTVGSDPSPALGVNNSISLGYDQTALLGE